MSELYVRNGRPNGIVFHYDGIRYKLEHRGHRQDSAALPASASNDRDIARWIQIGQLERITKEAFIELGKRMVDILPNEFVKQPVRNSSGGTVIPMKKAEGDISNTLTQIEDRDVYKTVKDSLSPQWGGDLMSTEEEMDSPEFQNAQSVPNYPSRHREDTRERGY